MNAGWRVVDCSQLVGSIRYSRGQIVIRNSDADQTATVPLAQIAVVLIGTRASISGAVLVKFGEYDIAAIVCDWRGVPVAGAYPWSDHTRVGARNVAQAKLSRPKMKRAWSEIIKAKVENQYLATGIITGCCDDTLNALAKQILSGDKTNIEAQAARYYWSVIGSNQFRRKSGLAIDPYNSALDYGYTIVRGLGIRAVKAAGLNGALGVFHHGRGNCFSLVDDLMEPFRPFIDCVVFKELDLTEGLTPAQKGRLVERIKTATFSSGGGNIQTTFEGFAHLYGLYVEGELDLLPVPQWIGDINADDGQ
ncbi:type II CRISPR-associated endonuclease Cas1 [Corynebacterium pyruviciproducens]